MSIQVVRSFGRSRAAFARRAPGVQARKRSRAGRVACSILAAGFLLILARAGQSAGASSLEVIWQGARLSVNASHTALADILRQVSQRTGIRVEGLEQLGQPVSVHFIGIPLGDALQNLLTGVNYVVIGDASTMQGIRKTQVIVLGPLQASQADAGAGGSIAEAAGRIQEEQLAEGVLSSEASVRQQALLRLGSLDPKVVARVLQRVMAGGDQGARIAALEYLDQSGRVSGPPLFSLLRDAASTGDAPVRQYAITALARRGGPEAMGILRDLFVDGDAQTRLLIVESIADRPEAHVLLEKATLDPDQTVSKAASQLLNIASTPNR